MWIKLLRLIDKYIFWLFNIILFPIKYIFNNKKYKKNPKKILVIRFWALWSSILTFPMICQLKKHYWKEVKYDVLTTSRTYGIYKNTWYFDTHYNLLKISHILKLIFNFKNYDIVIDTEDYFNISWLLSLWLWKINIWYNPIFTRKIVYNNSVIYDDLVHACIGFTYLLKPLWIKITEPKFLEKYKYTQENKNRVDDFFEKQNQENLNICLHTWWAETNSDRFWDINNWIKLINRLENKNINIFLSWTKFEEEVIMKIVNSVTNKNIINICNKFNLNEFACFLEKMDLMVSNDTWPMHLSASMKTKTIWLFWPNLPQRFWAYPLNTNINLYKWDFNPTINVHLWKFEEDKYNFVNKITVDEVFNTIIKEIT